MFCFVFYCLKEAGAGHKQTPQNVVISRNMDLELQDVIDLLMRDFILTWYQDLSRDRDSLQTHLKYDTSTHCLIIV